MEQEPNKWKKHLILVEFNLKTQTDLEKEIKRYPKQQIFQLMEDLKQRFHEDSEANAYLLSLIPRIDCFKLPNYIIKTEEDITDFLEFMRKREGLFSEVWCCEKPKREGLDNVIGRVSLSTGKTFRTEAEHIIEQVWSINHRDIEHYCMNSKMNYLRASREGWNRRYQLDHISMVDKKDKNKMLNDFITVVKNIENNRDKIEDFLEFLREIDISEIVLEYMLVGEQFKFIDWDTSNDKKVIQAVFQKGKEEFEEDDQCL